METSLRSCNYSQNSTGDYMLVQVHTGKDIEGGQGLHQYIISSVESDLSHFTEQITRVDVHFSDVNGPKSGVDDIRCQIEARIAHLNSVSVHCDGETIDLAFIGASTKLQHLLDSKLGELRHRRKQAPSIPIVPSPEDEDDRTDGIAL